MATSLHPDAAPSCLSRRRRDLLKEVKPSTSASNAGITVNAVAPGISETPQTLDEVNSLGAKRIAATAET